MSKRKGDPLLIGLSAFIHRLPRQSLGGFHELRFIERSERLQWSIGAQTTDTRGIAVGRVEGLQHRIRDAAEAEGVQGSSVPLGPLLLNPGLGSIARRRLEQELRGRRIHRSPSECGIDQPGYGQRDVPNDLTLDPKPRTPGQETVVGIALEQDRVHPTGLTVRRRTHDETVQMLEGPRSHARFGGLHELNGQPIEQCLVGSWGRLRPEVFNGLHQTHSEVLLPHTIDRHPRGGW